LAAVWYEPETAEKLPLAIFFAPATAAVLALHYRTAETAENLPLAGCGPANSHCGGIASLKRRRPRMMQTTGRLRTPPVATAEYCWLYYLRRRNSGRNCHWQVTDTASNNCGSGGFIANRRPRMSTHHWRY
jgi:hypothetical protein